MNPQEIEFEHIVALAAGVWVAGKTMLDAGTFVNDLRDSIVLGKRNGEPLMKAHMRVLRADWCLTMAAAIAFPTIISVLLIWLGRRFESYDTLLTAIAGVPAFGAALFAVCGLFDLKLINRAITAAEMKIGSGPVTERCTRQA